MFFVIVKEDKTRLKNGNHDSVFVIMSLTRCMFFFKFHNESLLLSIDFLVQLEESCLSIETDLSLIEADALRLNAKSSIH